MIAMRLHIGLPVLWTIATCVVATSAQDVNRYWYQMDQTLWDQLVYHKTDVPWEYAKLVRVNGDGVELRSSAEGVTHHRFTDLPEADRILARGVVDAVRANAQLQGSRFAAKSVESEDWATRLGAHPGISRKVYGEADVVHDAPTFQTYFSGIHLGERYFDRVNLHGMQYDLVSIDLSETNAGIEGLVVRDHADRIRRLSFRDAFDAELFDPAVHEVDIRLIAHYWHHNPFRYPSAKSSRSRASIMSDAHFARLRGPAVHVDVGHQELFYDDSLKLITDRAAKDARIMFSSAEALLDKVPELERPWHHKRFVFLGDRASMLADDLAVKGESEASKSEFRKAFRFYEAARTLADDPQGLEIQSRLGFVYFRLGELSSAMKLLSTAYIAANDDHQVAITAMLSELMTEIAMAEMDASSSKAKETHEMAISYAEAFVQSGLKDFPKTPPPITVYMARRVAENSFYPLESACRNATDDFHQRAKRQLHETRTWLVDFARKQKLKRNRGAFPFRHSPEKISSEIAKLDGSFEYCTVELAKRNAHARHLNAIARDFGRRFYPRPMNVTDLQLVGNEKQLQAIEEDIDSSRISFREELKRAYILRGDYIPVVESSLDLEEIRSRVRQKQMRQ